MDDLPLLVAGMLAVLLGATGRDDPEADERFAWCGAILVGLLAGLATLARG